MTTQIKFVELYKENGTLQRRDIHSIDVKKEIVNIEYLNELAIKFIKHKYGADFEGDDRLKIDENKDGSYTVNWNPARPTLDHTTKTGDEQSSNGPKI